MRPESTFTGDTKKAQSAAAKGEFDKVKLIVDELDRVKSRNLYEELYLQSLYVSYFDGIGQADRAYLHIHRVLGFYDEEDPKRRLVDADYFVPFHVKAYQYEVSKMMIGDAISTAAWLSYLAPNSEVARNIATHAEQLEQQANGKQFSIEATIETPVYGGDSGTISIRLLNKRVSLSNETGRIDKVRLFCGKGVAIPEYPSEEDWIIPQEWAECDLFIEGKVGSTFTVTEKPT